MRYLVGRRHRIGRSGVVFALAFALYAAGAHPRVFAAGNDASRWAQIESLVDYGSTSIERSRFAATVDRVEVGGRVYSNKPPLLSLAGAAIYAPLRGLTGWRLGDPATGGRMIALLTILLVALPAAACVAQFDHELGRFERLGGAARNALTAALGAGTLVLSYSGTLNNHVPAAALLFAAFAATLGGRPLAAGLACGFAGAVDFLPGFGLAPFLGWALLRDAPDAGRRAARFAAGVAAGLAAALLANLAVTGSVLPPKMLAGAVDFSAQAGPSWWGVVLPQDASYPVEVLLGPHGLFLVSPVLLLGVAGWMRAIRAAPFAPVSLYRAVALGLVCQVVGHALLAGSYGGWSYGFRYLLPIQPILLFAAPLAIETGLGRLALAATLPPSILFAALGAYHPWPPGFEQETRRDPIATQVTNPIGGNAAAWAAEHRPASAAAEWLGDRYVSRDAAMRRRYFVYFFGSKGDLATMRKFAR